MQRKSPMPNFVKCSRCGKRYNAFIHSCCPECGKPNKKIGACESCAKKRPDCGHNKRMFEGCPDYAEGS